MISLAELWRSWGIEPAAVVGHSMGEAAAAVVSGALSLEDGAAVICERSRLMRQTSGRGAMAVAELSRDEADQMAAPYHERVSVSAINSPSSVVFSGDVDAIEELVATLQAREVFAKLIKVDVASHSCHMDPIRSELERRLTPHRAAGRHDSPVLDHLRPGGNRGRAGLRALGTQPA